MSAPAAPAAAIWHDVECGSYAADLALWEELATGEASPVLELGAGTGRVSLSLAAAGHEVVAVDTSEELLDQLQGRAAAAGTPVETVRADARRLALDREFGLVIAPMQFVHLMGGQGGRQELLRAVRAHLRAGGRFAAALLSDDPTESGEGSPASPLPDVREVDGWLYSSLPVEVVAVDGQIEVRRLRQLVSPAGELTDEIDAIRLDLIDAAVFEREAVEAGFTVGERIRIEETADHVGSVVCVAEVGR